MKSQNLRKLVLAAFFAAIIFLGIYLIKIPIPNGYIHFGDGFVYVAAALLPMPFAIAAAAIGGLLADILAGYAVYAPFTAVVKLLMAVVVSILVRRSVGKTGSLTNIPRLAIASILGGVVNTAGYFLTDCILYDVAGALAAAPMNAIQSVFGIAVFFVFLPILAKALSLLSK